MNANDVVRAAVVRYPKGVADRLIPAGPDLVEIRRMVSSGVIGTSRPLTRLIKNG